MRYVGVFGPIRAGKTLISRALNMHENIMVQIEPFFFFFKLCRNIYYREILKINYDEKSPIESVFCWTKEEDQIFVKSFSSLVFESEDIEELKRYTIWQQKSAGDERAPMIIPHIQNLETGFAKDVFLQLTQILERAYPKKNLNYIGFSEAWCDHYARPLIDLSGVDINIINSVRDPRAVIASRNRGTNIKEKYGGKYPLMVLIRHWRSCVANAIVNKDNPYYLTVKYEDLVREPEVWFRTICKFLDVQFDHNVIHPEYYLNGSGKIWRQNTNFDAGSGFSTESIDKWKEKLNEKEIGFIEWMCKPELKYLGYEITQTQFDLHDLTGYKEDKIGIIDWLKSYNLTITPEEIELEIARQHILKTEKNYKQRHEMLLLPT